MAVKGLSYDAYQVSEHVTSEFCQTCQFLSISGPYD